MVKRGHSRLQSAFRNYLTSRDSGYQCISENTEKYERCVFKLKIIIYCLSAFVGYMFIAIYSKWYSNFFINVAWYFAILICFKFLLFRKYVPWGNLFGLLRRVFCCPWSCFTVSAEDRCTQTEEYTTCHHASLYNTADEQAVDLFNVQHVSEEQIAYEPTVLNPRTEEHAALFVFRNYLHSRRFGLRRLFCCLRSSCPTEDIGIQTEEHAAYESAAQHDTTEGQTTYQAYRIQGQAAYEPDAFRATSEEVSTKLQIVQQRLLRYLLSGTENQSPFSE